MLVTHKGDTEKVIFILRGKKNHKECLANNTENKRFAAKAFRLGAEASLDVQCTFAIDP